MSMTKFTSTLELVADPALDLAAFLLAPGGTALHLQVLLSASPQCES